MQDKRVAYIRIFGVPEIDEVNRIMTFGSCTDITGDSNVELFEDTDGTRLGEYLALEDDKIIVTDMTIMNMMISTIEDLEGYERKDNIYRACAKDVDIFRKLELKRVNTSKFLNEMRKYQLYLDLFIELILQTKYYKAVKELEEL